MVEQGKIKNLQEQLTTLRQELDSLAAQSSGFPAFERNAARISASLSMMETALGMYNSSLDRA